MNFEDIKRSMDQSVEGREKAATKVDLARGKNNPVQFIRRKMRNEIVSQLLIIVVFMLAPFALEMYMLPNAVYYIMMFITSWMTLAYSVKMTRFLKRTGTFSGDTKSAIQGFIFEARLTLEVYKSFIIGGSLLLPISLFCISVGSKSKGNEALFQKWFTLNVSSVELVGLIVGYLAISAAIYFITLKWTERLYGKHLTELETILNELEGE